MVIDVHLPKPLLAALDRQARALNTSRDRLIVQALERELARPADWSPDFFARLEMPEPGIETAVDEMLEAIAASRSSKRPTRF